MRRPQDTLKPSSAKPSTPVLVFDLGGSHVSSAVFDKQLCPIATNLIGANGDAEQILSKIEIVARSALQLANCPVDALAGISMAAPGPFDYREGMSLMRHKHPGLYGHSLRQSLARLLGVNSDAILFLNDANAFLLGEVSRCGFHEVDRVVGITLGTGVGSSFVMKGQVVEGGAGVPPLGVIYDLPWEDGTVEDLISTRFLVQRYKDLGGEEISVRQIADAAIKDLAAKAVMEEFGTNLGCVLRELLTEFDPDLIILGGGITRGSSSFLDSMKAQCTSLRAEIHLCGRLDAAPLIGAAQFALPRLLSREGEKLSNQANARLQ